MDSKVIHVPYCFYPDPVGGTEVYVYHLARALEAQGVASVIAAPGAQNETYSYQGLTVHRFAVSERVADLSELYGAGDALAAKNMAAILEREQPTLLHLHSVTRAASLRLVRTAHRFQLPVVFTYHTPTVSCARGTLLRWGRQTCEGRVEVNRCTACVLQGHGVPRPFAEIAARMTPTRRGWLGPRAGGVWTVLRMRELQTLRRATLHAFFTEVDYIVALAPWTIEVLKRNGVAAEKISLIPHGRFRPSEIKARPATPVKRNGTLRIAALGRLEPIKGFHILIAALRALPTAPITLDIYGIAQGEKGERYAGQLQRLSKGDQRIRFHATLPDDRVVSELENYDLLAVPSQSFETGPLVVLDAFAAGIPVLGSNLGGIADKVEHGVNGWLVEPGSVAAWRKTLGQLVDNRDLLARLRRQVSAPRTMSVVAQELRRLYEQVQAPANAARTTMPGAGMSCT